MRSLPGYRLPVPGWKLPVPGRVLPAFGSREASATCHAVPGRRLCCSDRCRLAGLSSRRSARLSSRRGCCGHPGAVSPARLLSCTTADWRAVSVGAQGCSALRSVISRRLRALMTARPSWPGPPQPPLVLLWRGCDHVASQPRILVPRSDRRHPTAPTGAVVETDAPPLPKITV